MRRSVFVIFLTVVCACAVAQSTLLLPYSATRLTDEERTTNPDRLAYPTELKNLVANDVGFACNTPPVTVLTGKFSVSSNLQVTFSSGNLQYNAAKGTHLCADGTTQQGTWRFAEHQWDFVGDATDGDVYVDGVKCDNTKIAEDYNGWIDLFGWGTSGWNSGAKAYQPWASSKKISDYCPGGDPDNNLTDAYAYSDWGQYNAIGTDPAGTWRTLTTEEWIYLLRERNNYDRLFGYATVNGVQGIILLPDTWELPADIVFHSCADMGFVLEESGYQSDTEHYADNIYASSVWDKMADAGAVFLPCAGWRNGKSTTETLWYGDYWSVSSGEESAAYFLRFRGDILNPQYGYNRYRGRSIRLVKDEPQPEPESKFTPKPFSVSANKQITFSSGNLQYNAAKGTHQCADGMTQQGTWRFAEHQWDYVGDGEVGNVYDNGKKCDNALVSNDYDGWIDIFGWGTSGWDSGANEYYPWALSEDNADYIPGGDVNNDPTDSYAYADWSVYNKIGGDAPETWRTLSKDEWVYLFRERENAEKLFAMETVNGVGGTIILLDEWVTPAGLTFTPSTGKGFVWEDDTHFSGGNKHYSDNIYTLAQWQQMESAGAVFLPAAGCRVEEGLQRANGRYWSSTHASVNGSYYLRFAADYLYTHFYYNRKRGFSVRPVKDAVTDPNLH